MEDGTIPGGTASSGGRGRGERGPWALLFRVRPRLFTRKNTGVEVKSVVTGRGSSKVVCPLTGLLSSGRGLESDLEGPHEGNGASFLIGLLSFLMVASG